MKSRIKTLPLSIAMLGVMVPVTACDDYLIGIVYPGSFGGYYDTCCYGGFYVSGDDDDDFFDDLEDFWDDLEDDWDDLFDD